MGRKKQGKTIKKVSSIRIESNLKDRITHDFGGIQVFLDIAVYLYTMGPLSIKGKFIARLKRMQGRE